MLILIDFPKVGHVQLSSHIKDVPEGPRCDKVYVCLCTCVYVDVCMHVYMYTRIYTTLHGENN